MCLRFLFASRVCLAGVQQPTASLQTGWEPATGAQQGLAANAHRQQGAYKAAVSSIFIIGKEAERYYVTFNI